MRTHKHTGNMIPKADCAKLFGDNEFKEQNIKRHYPTTDMVIQSFQYTYFNSQKVENGVCKFNKLDSKG